MNTTNQPLPNFDALRQSIDTMHRCAVDALARAQRAEMERDSIEAHLIAVLHTCAVHRWNCNSDERDSLAAARAALKSLVRISPD